jgi:glycine/D-amino acid oxidase-like deaminating enzyme
MTVISTEFKSTPYWWEAAPPIDGTRDAPERVYDAVVIGSGVTGLSSALTLAEGGRKVLLLDAEKIGSGSSSRNNGSVVPFGFVHQELLEKRHGSELGAAVANVAVDAFNYLTALPERYGFDPMLKPYERFFLACTPGHYQHMAADAALQAERGIGLNWKPMERGEMERRTRVESYHGALHIENSMALHPGLYVNGLVQAAILAGVEMVGNCRVLGIKPGAGGQIVLTERGEVRAKNVIMSTNAYSDSGVAFLQRRIIPVRLYLSATEPVSPDLMRKYFPDRQLADSKRSMSWIRPSPDGTRLLVGGRGGMMGNDPERHAAKLYGDMVRMVPELEGLKLTHCWYGRVGFAMDFNPHIGEVGGVHYAAAYAGVGLCFGTYLGSRLGNRILGKPAAECHTALDSLKFHRIPGPSFLNQIYSRLGVEWYNLRDWWDMRGH